MIIRSDKQLGLMLQENPKINRHFFKVHYDRYVKDKNLSTDDFKYYVNELIDFIMNPTHKD